MQKANILLLLICFFTAFLSVQAIPISSNIASLSISMPDKLFLEKRAFFDVNAVSIDGNSLLGNSFTYEVLDSSGNIVESYFYRRECDLKNYETTMPADCYFMFGAGNKGYGYLDISNSYYDIDGNYTLRVHAGTISKDFSFTVGAWQLKETGFDAMIFIKDNAFYIVFIFFGIILIFLAVKLFLYFTVGGK